MLSPLLIINETFSLKTAGIIYCDKCRHVLYIGQFTKEPPITDYEKEISVEEIIGGLRTGLIEQQRYNFASFIESMSYEEKKYIVPINVEKYDLDDPQTDSCSLIIDNIKKYDIDSIVTDNEKTARDIRDSLSIELPISTCQQQLPPLCEQSWIKRAVSKVYQYFSYNGERKELFLSIYILMREYHIPKSTMRDTCMDILNEKDIKEIERRGYF